MATDIPSPPKPVKPARIGRFMIGFNVLVQCALALLVLLMVNYLSFNHYRRWDFTRNHFYSLSDKSLRVLGGLKKKVKVYILFQQESNILPDVKNLLKEYQYRSNGKLDVEIIDSYRDQARAEELQNKYKFGGKENIVILDNDGRQKFVNEIAMEDLDTSGMQSGQPAVLLGFKGEQAITSGLLEITDDRPNVLYAITGHGERDINGDDFGIVKNYVERENVKVRLLPLQTADSIPADAGLLFIFGPRFDFTDNEMKLLRDYWDKKGRIFILLDPNFQKQTPKLMDFLMAQGVKPEDDRILKVQRTQIATVAQVVRYVTANFVGDSPITKNINGVTGLFQGDTQSLTLAASKPPADDIRLKMLVQANEGYWGARDYNFTEGEAPPIFLPLRDVGQPLAVAASVEKGALAHVDVDSSRMVVVANSDFISSRSLNLANANLDFTINSVDWLLDRTELIGIAPKDYTAFTLNLSDKQLSNILTTTTFIIPLLAGVFGLALWWKRRH